MKRGGLLGRVARLEDTGAGECQVCHGRGGPTSFYMDRGDGVCRDKDGRVMSDADLDWTCPACRRHYTSRRVVIQVIGHSTGTPGTTRRGSFQSHD